MYHASAGMTYAATKSNDPAGYGRWACTVQTYPEIGRFSVDFTCTLTKRPVVPTTKSYGHMSPQGLLTGKPCSCALAMKTDSAHSPRCFLCSMMLGLRG